MDQGKSVAIELLEQRVAELERVRTSLQTLNTELTFQKRDLQQKLDLLTKVVVDCQLLDCSKPAEIDKLVEQLVAGRSYDVAI